ncbi:nucleotidyltransferase domain-containing protein [Candidatus Woesearchaeota archaeon]|nr:nucleotidyltransferase domain-containing protein [Candidatus Woesearchaeota archaeon]
MEMFTENIIGSKAKVKILRVLSEVRTAYTLKDIVEETGLSLSITHKAAEELHDENILIKIKGSGKEKLYKFNAEGVFASSLFELFKIEKTKQRRDVILLKTWNILENLLTTIKNDISVLILFGSQARGEATLKSDVDVLIIPKEKVRLLESIKKIDKKLQPVFMNRAALQAEMKNKTPFYNNLKRDGVFLFIAKDLKKDMKEIFPEKNSEH